MELRYQVKVVTTGWFDVVDTMLDKTVGYYSEKPSWKGDTNYGYQAAVEMAEVMNEAEMEMMS